MEEETEKLRVELQEFISKCEDEVLLERMPKAAEKYYGKND